MRRRTLGQTLAGLAWMLVSGAIFSLLGGLAFHALGPAAIIVLFVLMFLGGLATALVAHVLGIDEELGTAATVAVVVGLLPGAPLTTYWLGGRGEVAEVASAADAMAKREARYFRIATPPDAKRALAYTRRSTASSKSPKTYLVVDMLTPIADAAEAPRVFVVHPEVASAHVLATASAAEAEARARHQELLANTGPWFRRRDALAGHRGTVLPAAGAEPWLFLEPVESAAQDRFRRGIWLAVVAALATVAVGAYAFTTRFERVEKRNPKHGPYR